MNTEKIKIELYTDAGWLRDFILDEALSGRRPCWQNFPASGRLAGLIEQTRSALADNGVAVTDSEIEEVLAKTFDHEVRIVAREMDDESIWVRETPHQGDSEEWRALNDRDFCERVKELPYSPNRYRIETLTEAQFREAFGDEDTGSVEGYEAELEILKRHGTIVSVVYNAEHSGDDIEFFAPGTEPAEFDVARRSLGRDLSRLTVVRKADIVKLVEA